jgi:glyoxylase-like metal-dependent hydrolase (beta-lactamase superfamily II)
MIVILLCAAAPVGAQSFDSVEINTIPAAPGIYMLEGRGGNIGVSIGKDGVFLIDDQFAPLTEKILKAIRKLSDGPIRFVLNTHWHGDHTGGNENLGKAGALIVAHENVRKRMSIEQFLGVLNRRVPPSPPVALPIVTFTDAVTFHLNDEEIHVFHVAPSHTDGDSIVHFRKANVIHAGDILFSGRYPFIDTSTGGSIDGVIASAGRVLELTDKDTKIIPGHGPLSGPKELRAYRDMLSAVRKRVSSAIAGGKTLEETVASKPTAEFDGVFDGARLGADRFVQMVYGDLSGN